MDYAAVLCFLALSLTTAQSVMAQPAISDNRPLSIGAVAAVSSETPQFGKAEFRVDLQGTYANAFAPDEIDVRGEFRAPDGSSITIPAFFMQDYSRQLKDGQESLTPVGVAGWRLRFSPARIGRYSLVVSARDRSGRSVHSKAVGFRCVASDDPGYIRRGADSRYFEFDSGKPYFAIGANVCWAGGRGTYDYDDWLARYGKAGCNYLRLWLGPGWTTFGLEHTNEGCGLGKFDQEKSWKLDCVMDLAREQGLYAMLCLDSYNELRRKSEGGYGCWEDTPHTAANGGPLKEPKEFWTNPTMLSLYRNKLRYLVARYGWDTHVMSWEFWNEVDIISQDAFKPGEVAKWHADMSDYLRSIDPWKHLQTTSFAGSGGVSVIDRLPQIDYTQTHAYGLADGAADLTHWLDIKQSYGKPSYVGEFGADAGGSDRTVDPTGILLHDGIWSSTMHGAAGSAMLWYWDNHIAPGNLYYHFAALSGFINGVDFPRQGFAPIADASFAFIDHSAESPWHDLILSGPSSWEPSEANRPTTVKIDADGTHTIQGAISGILHGMVNHKDLHNPVTLELNLPHPTRVHVTVSGVSGYGGAHLVCAMDGAVILDRPMPDTNSAGKHDTLQQYNRDYLIDVPAGAHTVKVENTGTDWMLVSYVIEQAERASGPTLRLYGMRGKRVSLIWIQNTMHTYKRVNISGHLPDPVPPTLLTMPNWPKGTYGVTFWDTYAGKEIETKAVHADASGLRVKLPAIQTDIALKITSGKAR